MSNVTVGREPIQVVQINQQLCSLSFGVAPCTASLIGGDASTKCFNTYPTCRDQANFTAGDGLDLFFARPNQKTGTPQMLSGGSSSVTGPILSGGGSATVFTGAISGGTSASFASIYVIPSLKSVSTAPTTINIIGADRNVSPLGYRAVLQVSLSDHPHTDRVVDPYLSDRSYTPMNNGSFWSKWLVRNKYYKGYKITVYDGYDGEDVSVMRSREYIIDSISGPDSAGSVSITAKDILSKAESRKAIAPLKSQGELYADITVSSTTFEVAGGVVADYAASGTVRIGDELMEYSAVASIDNRLTFTITTRGTDGTISETHSAGDNVQNVLEYTAQNSWDIAKDLLINHAGIDSSYIADADWTAEGSTYLPDFVFTAKIADPTPVSDLISELCEQSLFYIWWDEVAKEIKLRAVRGITSPPATLSDDFNILAGSFSQVEKPNRRVSQVWTGYKQRNVAQGIAEDNFNVYDVFADLEAESANKYGEPAIRKILSRWTDNRNLVTEMNSKLLGRFSESVKEATIEVDAKDRAYWVGDVVYLSHYAIIDQYGAKDVKLWQIISAEETVPGERLRLVLDDAALDGVVRVYAADADIDWVGDGSDKFQGMWYSDDNGLLPDGSTGTLWG